MEQFIINWLRKGVPSLFVSIKPLLRDVQKKIIIEKIVQKLHLSMTTNKKFIEDGILFLFLFFVFVFDKINININL